MKNLSSELDLSYQELSEVIKYVSNKYVMDIMTAQYAISGAIKVEGFVIPKEPIHPGMREVSVSQEANANKAAIKVVKRLYSCLDSCPKCVDEISTAVEYINKFIFDYCVKEVYPMGPPEDDYITIPKIVVEKSFFQRLKDKLSKLS